MPSELEELVEFLHHGNTQIRQTAVEHLVGYSTAQPSLFKRNQLEPVKDLKVLVKDYTPIAHNAITILINISNDKEVLENLASDKAFLETLVQRITKPTEPNADFLAMLLANISKSPHATTLLNLTLKPVPNLSTSSLAATQLLDAFVRGASGGYNARANFDHLSYVIADLGAHAAGRAYLVGTAQHGNDDGVVPLAKVAVFVEHGRAVRRRGAAAALKNAAFETAAHAALLDPHGAVNLLPYVLAPLMGGEEYGEEGDSLPDEVQLLPPDKQRETEVDIVKTHLETLLLLSSTRHGREVLRAKSVYAVVREVHLQVEDEDVREVCDRIVQVLMRGEPEEEGEGQEGSKIEEVDSDEEIVDVL